MTNGPNLDDESQKESASIIAFAAPFVCYIVLTTIDSMESLRGYYPWLYAFKVIVVGALCIMFSGHWPAFRSKGIGLGIAFGIAGIFAWVLISNIHAEHWVLEKGAHAFSAVSTQMGMEGYDQAWVDKFVESSLPERVGYNPWEKIPSNLGATIFLIVRFAGLALLVPIIEEVFWRGFLLRYLIDERFDRVPIGTYSTLSFVVVTILFAAAHPEILAAIVWGAGINILLYKTRNLWACVVGHAVTNFLLGAYVLWSGQWMLW